jgi:hypothetical protein
VAIDMSSGGGKDEDDVVGDGSLGEEGPPKPEESDISSLPIQAGVGILLPPSMAPEVTALSCKVGDNSAAGRLFISSFAVEPAVAGLKSGSSLTMGGRSSDWLGFTASKLPGRGPANVCRGLGESLLSFSSGAPSLDATPLASTALVAEAEMAEEALFKVAMGLADEDSLGAATCSAMAGAIASVLLPAGISGDEVREPPPADPEPALRASLGSRS